VRYEPPSINFHLEETLLRDRMSSGLKPDKAFGPELAPSDGELRALIRSLWEAQRTCCEIVGLVDPTLLIHSGQMPAWIPALQQAPDPILANPLCCRLPARGSICNSIN